MSGFWWAVGGILGLALLAVLAITIADIVRSHLGAGKTAAWLLIVLLLPFIGSVLYWTLRKPSGDEVQHQLDAERSVRETAARRPFDHPGM